MESCGGLCLSWRCWRYGGGVFLTSCSGVFPPLSSGNDDDDDEAYVPPVETLSTHLVDLTKTSVTWNGDSSSVTNTVASEAWLVYNHKVNLATDSITLEAKVRFSSLGGHNGIGFISVEGTKRKGYQLLSGQNIKNVGCTGGGGGQGFDNGSVSWETNKDYVFKVVLAENKISWYVTDGSGTTREKVNASIYHDENDIVYPAFGGTQASNVTYSNIKVTVNDETVDIDGIDPQGQLPTLSLDTPIVRLKSNATATVNYTATYNGDSCDVKVQCDNTLVNATANNGVITITPLQRTAGTDVTVIHGKKDYITVKFTVVVADFPEKNEYTLSVYPAQSAMNAYTDGTLRITFDSTPEISNGGFVAVYDDAGKLVDTITMTNEKQIAGGHTVSVSNQLVRVSGNDVLITPHFGILENSKKYYVAIPEGAITGQIGGKEFKGLSDAKDAEGAWSFTTRAAVSAKPTMTVDASESASPDFRTLYGALAAIGNAEGNYTINVAAGEYYELVHATLADNTTVTIVGPESAEFGGTDAAKNAVITYINHNDWNPGTDIRPVFFVNGGNLVLKNLTIWNKTKRGENIDSGEAQAEALYFKSTGKLAAYNCTFKSYQDTVQVGKQGGKAWFYKCYIEGDVDFLWGTADVALFEECTLKALNDAERSTKTEDLLVARTYLKNDKIGKGFVVFNSKIEVEDGITLAFGRCAGAGTGFYDQCAVVNTAVMGTLSDAWWTAKSYTPLAGHETNVGWKDYGITVNGTAASPQSRLEKTSAISDDLYNAEYKGRAVILNRVYDSTTKEYENTEPLWDYKALETEFSATADNSVLSGEVKPVTVTWDFTKDFAQDECNYQGRTEMLADKTYGIKLNVDASASGGKFWTRGTDVQVNANTVIKVPVSVGSVVTVVSYPGYGYYAIAGETPDEVAKQEDEFSTNPAMEKGYVEIKVNGSAYFCSISVTNIVLSDW